MTIRHRSLFSLSLLGTIALAWLPSYAQPTKAPKEKPLDKDHAAKMAKGLDIFKKHVKPVLMQKCLRCHGGKEVEAEFDLSDRDELLRGGNKGPAIVAGKAKESLLYKLISHAKQAVHAAQGSQAARRDHRPHRRVDRPRGPVR